MKKKLLFIIVLLFVCCNLSGDTLLNPQVILKSKYAGYNYDDEVLSGRAVEKLTPEEYFQFKKNNHNSIITKKHLWAVNSNKNRNLKSIDFSIQSSGYKGKYIHDYIFDDDLSTAWVEKNESFGNGEWINLNIINHYENDKKNYYKPFWRIIIYPGFGKSKELFYQNNRLKTAILFASVTDSSGVIREDEITKDNELQKLVYCQRLFFDDEPRYYIFDLPEYPEFAGKKYSFRLYIETVYKGTKYDDTCISEVQLLW